MIQTKVKYTLELIKGVTEPFEVDPCWGNPKITCLCSRCAAVSRNTSHYLVPFEHQTYDTCDMSDGRPGTDYAEFEYIGYNSKAA